MNKINSMDPKFEKMLIKTNNANILGKAEQLLKECDNSTNLISHETFCKLFFMFVWSFRYYEMSS